MDQKTLDLIAKYVNPIPANEIRSYVNLAFFGDHGTWKTTTACRIGAHRGRVMLYTMDNDHTSLKNHPEIRANVDIVEYVDMFQLMVMGKALKENPEAFSGFSTFVLDTAGGWIEKFVEEMAKHVKIGTNGRTVIEGRDAIGKAMIRDMDLSAPELTDYNIARMEFRSIVRNLCDSPFNIVFNCHSRLQDTGQDKTVSWKRIRPDMPEACFTVLARKCDSLGFFENDGKKPESTISFKQSASVTTKSRIGSLYGKILPVSKAVSTINEWMEK